MRPELGDITAASFERQIEASVIGRKAALAVADRLRALSVSPEAYQAWKGKVRLEPGPKPPVVDEVRVAQTRFVNPGELRAAMSQKDGEVLDSKALEKDLVLVYSRGDLMSLDYSVLQERDKTILKLTPIEKSWGPDYLRFGINLSSDFRSESPYNLRALYRKTWMNPFGGEWLTTAQMGSNQGLGTEFYQPLDYRQRFFVRPFIGMDQQKVGLYFDDNRLAEYRTREGRVGVDLGVNLGVYGQAKVGWLERQLRATLDTGDPVFPDSKQRGRRRAAPRSPSTRRISPSSPRRATRRTWTTSRPSASRTCREVRPRRRAPERRLVARATSSSWAGWRAGRRRTAPSRSSTPSPWAASAACRPSPRRRSSATTPTAS